MFDRDHGPGVTQKECCCQARLAPCKLSWADQIESLQENGSYNFRVKRIRRDEKMLLSLKRDQNLKMHVFRSTALRVPMGFESVFRFGREEKARLKYRHQSLWNVTTSSGWNIFPWLVTKTDTRIRTLDLGDCRVGLRFPRSHNLNQASHCFRSPSKS